MQAAIVVIQRRSRGFLDRRVVHEMKQAKLVHVSARLMQATFRRHAGSDRMKKRREFVAAKKTILRSAQQLYPSYLAQVRLCGCVCVACVLVVFVVVFVVVVVVAVVFGVWLCCVWGVVMLC